MSRGAKLIAEERERQITEEGYDPQKDVGRSDELLQAANAYLYYEDARENWGLILTIDEVGFPWHYSYWKPSDDSIRNLTKAGALIAAAIDARELENKQ